MPNITEFDAGNLAIHPTETGVESFAAAGRRAGAFYNQAAESSARLGAEIGQDIRLGGDAAVAYMDHQQINAGADHASTMWANLQDNWNQTQAGADPHDPSVAKKWREEVLEPTLDQFAQGFTTEKAQEWANGRVNTLRQHFFATTEADMSRNAKVAVEATLRNMHNNYTNALMKDPSGLSGVLDQIDHSMEGMLAANPNIKGPDAAEVRLGAGEKLKEAAVKAAVQGAIIKGGNWQSIANDPKYSKYIDAGEIQQFARAERTYQRMEQAEARNARVMNDYVNKQNFNAVADKLELSTLPQKVGDPVVLPPNYWEDVKKIGTMPGVDPGRLRSLIDNGERVTERMNMPKVANDQALSDSLFTRALADPNFSERDIAANITHLDDNNVRRLTEVVKMLRDDELNNPFFKSAMAGAKELIEGKTDLERSMSAGKFAEFEYSFLHQYLTAARSPTGVPGDALNMENPDSMISKAMAPYKNTVQEILRKSLGTNGMAAPPPMPTQPAKPAQGPPEVGAVKPFQGKLYQFQGGDWNDPKNWKEIS